MDSVIIFLSLVGYVLARGPHHPRNAEVTKHHVHYRPTRGVTQTDKLTNDAALLHDTEHIQEDLGAWVSDKDINDMTDEELEFHYFQLHDFDRNNHLDGLEILQAIHHTENHEHDHDHPKENEDPEVKKLENEANFEYYVELIDKVLQDDDTDNDGFLSYAEYAAGRKRENQRKAKEIEEEQKLLAEAASQEE